MKAYESSFQKLSSTHIFWVFTSLVWKFLNMTTNLKLCPNGCSSVCGLIRWMEKKISRGFFSAYFCGMSGSILDHFGKKLESGLVVFLERVGKSAVCAIHLHVESTMIHAGGRGGITNDAPSLSIYQLFLITTLIP